MKVYYQSYKFAETHTEIASQSQVGVFYEVVAGQISAQHTAHHPVHHPVTSSGSPGTFVQILCSNYKKWKV